MVDGFAAVGMTSTTAVRLQPHPKHGFVPIVGGVGQCTS